MKLSLPIFLSMRMRRKMLSEVPDFEFSPDLLNYKINNRECINRQ